MPSKAKRIDRAVNKLPLIPKEVVSHFLTGPMSGEAINAAGAAFKKALTKAALDAELSHHLGYEPGEDQPAGTTNHRNGVTAKTVLTGDGRLPIETPRDRDGSFEPVLIPKHARRFTGFDDTVIALYARGLTVREIQGFLLETDGTEVSADFISTVTDGIQAEVMAWQTRPLETMYPVVFVDALRVKIRDQGVVRNKAVYLALGLRRDGTREILGIWIENTGRAKFWLKVFNELRNRGTSDILIAVTDGLNGMEQALAAVFPQTTLQTCIVHLIRNSLDDPSPLWASPRNLGQRRQLEGSQGSRRGATPDLCGPDGRGRRSGTGCIRGRRVGPQVPHRRQGMAAGLGAGDPVLRFSAGGSAR